MAKKIYLSLEPETNSGEICRVVRKTACSLVDEFRSCLPGRVRMLQGYLQGNSHDYVILLLSQQVSVLLKTGEAHIDLSEGALYACRFTESPLKKRLTVSVYNCRTKPLLSKAFRYKDEENSIHIAIEGNLIHGSFSKEIAQIIRQFLEVSLNRPPEIKDIADTFCRIRGINIKTLIVG